LPAGKLAINYKPRFCDGIGDRVEVALGKDRKLVKVKKRRHSNSTANAYAQVPFG
jgi:4-diphosphocytidyl-2C-methyl-D-erythritol kinase